MTRPSRCERRTARAVVAVGVLLASGGARADDDERAAAEALFSAGRELVDAGDWDNGCPKFEASIKLFASASTMINIARCHEHAGRLASAWFAYRRALTLNVETQGAERQRALEEIAKQGAATLEPKLPRIRIVVAKPPPGMKVVRDGSELAIGALGEALPADPGPHEVRVEARGHRNEVRRFVLEPGKTETVEVTLVSDAPAPVEPIAPPPGDAASSSSVPSWAWIVGGVGVASSMLAVVFLADDLSASAALRENCFSDARGTGCRPGYDHEADNARKDRSLALSIVFGGIGVGALGVAAYGILTAERTGGDAASARSTLPHVGAWAAPGSGGAFAVGAF